MSGEDLAAVVAAAGDAIVAFAIDGRVAHWNPAAERLYGYPAAEVVGRAVYDALPRQWGDDVLTILERVAHGEHIDDHEASRRRKDGTWIVVASTVRPIYGEEGRVVGASVVARDLTARKRADCVLAEEAVILEMVAGGEDLGVTLDAVARFTQDHTSASRCSILLLGNDGTLSHGGGLHLSGIEDHRIDVTTGPPVGPYGTAAMIMADLAAGPSSGAELRHVARRLGVRGCWSQPILTPRTDGVAGSLVLYTEAQPPVEADRKLVDRATHLAGLAIQHHRTMVQLAHQANHDPLTGAGNRNLVLDRLGRALAERKRHGSLLALLFLDLDRFKALNDSHGHDAGDQVLVILAKRLHGTLRREDTLARLGGDEFVVLCEHLSGELEAVGVAERVARTVSQPFSVNQSEVALTASIGIAFPRDPDMTAEALLEQADAAMYQAKERGKARWQVFDRAMHQQALKRLQTERALRVALDREQFRLHYQPVVQLLDGQVVGAEALLRWNHPERGLLSPAEFIDVAEDTGLIFPIGNWVLEEACRQAARWERAGREASPVKVQVNVSGWQLSHARFPDAVRAAVDAAGADPENLCLEITEAVLIEHGPAAMRSLEAIKDLGLSLSIDDFGTGYSSLAYVDRFPIDELKVDRVLVEGLTPAGRGSTIVMAVLGLARALDLRVVAEGAETAEQVEQLKDMGCERAQGYYWSRPVGADELVLA